MKKVVSLAVSRKKGTPKAQVDAVLLKKEHGVDGDAHAGPWHRQVSFLAAEQIDAARDRGLDVDFGSFAENIATVGVDWVTLPIGTRVRVGEQAEVEITQIGKECHTKCAIYYQAGDCIMPRQGVFARVLKEGLVRTGDTVAILHVPEADPTAK